MAGRGEAPPLLWGHAHTGTPSSVGRDSHEA